MTTAVIFDLDGVLVDSEPYWQQGFATVANGWIADSGHDHPSLAAADMGTYAGGRVNETLRDIVSKIDPAGEAPDEVIDRLTDQVITQVSAAFRADPVAITSSVDTARALHARGTRLAVCSSSALPFIETVIDVLDLPGVFGVRSSALLLEHGKPHPQVYLETLQALDLPASACLAIEDSPRGIGAAVAADIRCLGLWRGGGQPPAAFDPCVGVTATLTLADVDGVMYELG